MTYGTTSASITNDVIFQRFNPATGIPDFGPIAAPGSLTLQLGNSTNPLNFSDFATVHLGNAQRGTYSGFIRVTVTVL